MDTDSLRYLGRLGRPWGHRGELTVHLENVELDDITHAGSLFVDIEGQRVPFFFSRLYEKGRDTLIQFDDLHDPQSASILVGRDIYAPPGHMADGSDESWDPDEFIGLLVRDEKHGDLGEVTAIEGTDRNPVLVILRGEQEVMVPLADEMIVDLDMEERSLVIRTPDGLIDLYRTP
ncbi:MAG: 16S rRNA processing protein RimM [Bacteroidetes bacterium]|nr:16S rRNA processing protein RimM [Bacteroidota bacterium]MBX7128290.1 ribosome maturation factor RimM [Flavobacteriales bacterium]HMU14540.1 ribosome maturation factor RimM [Flavobacteriales bacterium]HNE80090.1 ribosome maturation factor RimM [Flavobacteriales bacterium]HNI04625.1 ribosome maturation factor RimM [Flavobacteriales bacterium]